MSRLFYHTMQDNVGNLLFDVSGTMRLAGTGTLATIYGDEALTVILPNPMTNHPSFGSFKCFLGAGDYDFYMAKSGYTFETLTGVQGHGTMAQQDANAVLITGGDATLASLQVDNPTLLVDPALNSVGFGTAPSAGFAIRAASAEVLGSFTVDNPTFLVDAALNSVGMRAAPNALASLVVHHVRGTNHGVIMTTTGDGGGTSDISFRNAASAEVGYIVTSAVATTYNTASDARLKHDVTNLTGELALLQALRPVRFKWNVDDSEGAGFLAQEVAAVVAGVIAGESDGMNADGSIRPQGIDYAKLVPYVVGAVKTLAAQVESLTARLVVLEDALGI